MSLSNRLLYRRGPIRSLDTLCETIETTRAQLDKLTAHANSMYRLVPQVKRDGSPRETWDAHSQLKRVQGLINKRLLTCVEYPLYLQGGIRDRNAPRDYVRHVAFHAGARIAVTLDIRNFFPSVTEDNVFRIWRDFFRFSDDVACALTKLTTKDGVLPQGARTSSYLSNLVFFCDEHVLVGRLSAKGWAYSRFVDDITLSSRATSECDEASAICASTIAYLRAHGFRVRRSKLAVFRQGRRILLNGLVANVRPTLPKEERNRIRGQVGAIIRSVQYGTMPSEHEWMCVVGKLVKLERFHPKQAALLRAQLADL